LGAQSAAPDSITHYLPQFEIMLDAGAEICSIGQRLYDRGFAAANDGNISIRLDENRVLCTPTMTSKGFMTIDDLCVVDMDAQQISGTKRRSSEVKLHLEIYRQRPDVKSVVHCHPPHATAFAITREAIPQCVLPEVEIFLGEVPIAPYETPGSAEFSQSIVPFIKDCNVIVLANHGTVSFGTTAELAYWYTDILDAYCRVLLLAQPIAPIQYIPDGKCKELLEYKQEWGYSDLRIYGPEPGCNVCGHQAFKASWPAANVARRGFPESPAKHSPQPPLSLSDTDVERIAKRVAALLKAS